MGKGLSYDNSESGNNKSDNDNTIIKPLSSQMA